MRRLGAEMDDSLSRGGWSTPSGCVGVSCIYRAEWSLDTESDMISFTVIANQSADQWTGIAFAPEPQMVSRPSELLSICWQREGFWHRGGIDYFVAPSAWGFLVCDVILGGIMSCLVRYDGGEWTIFITGP